MTPGQITHVYGSPMGTYNQSQPYYERAFNRSIGFAYILFSARLKGNVCQKCCDYLKCFYLPFFLQIFTMEVDSDPALLKLQKSQ